MLCQVAPHPTAPPRPRERPTPLCVGYAPCQKVADVILGALAPALPARVIAHCHGGTLAIYSGVDPRSGEYFVDYEVYAGVSGARSTKDGVDGIANHTTNTSNLPIEALETEFPILVERYEFLPDSGGPGKFRGGLGVVREVRALGDDLMVGGWGCDQRAAPRGLFGAGPGVAGGFHVVDAEGLVRETVRSTVKGIQLPPRGRLRVHTSGGGGYGDPLDRDPELVLRDIGAGKVSPEHAEAVYGVVVTAAGVDRAATERVRAACRAGDGP